MTPLSYSGYRFPPDIIQRAVWMYLRFTLSFRDVEELLAEQASRSPTRASGAGSSPSARPLHEGCGPDARNRMDGGTSTRWWFALEESRCTCGELLMPKARS